MGLIEERLFAKTVGKLALSDNLQSGVVNCIISQTAQQEGIVNQKIIDKVKLRLRRAFPSQFRR